MRIAVVGAGVSGLVCAYLLAPAHTVTLFEQEHRLGGHTNTVRVEHEGRSLAVDTGFIVFNEHNYPNFCKLLDRLQVASRKTTMSFSVRDDSTGFEFGGSSAAGIVGSVSNVLRPRWWRVVRGVAQLGKQGKALLAEVSAEDSQTVTIGDLHRQRRFSSGFLDDYLVPMAAAIWSAPREALLEFPAEFFLRFFDNHGMLDLRERPQWRTVEGGSDAYIRAMRETLGPIARTACGVRRIERTGESVRVWSGDRDAPPETFDQVIIAAHADQALAMLSDPSETERRVLGAMPYQANETVLHTDERLLPARRRCWAAWNYRLAEDDTSPVAVTYNMTMLQGLGTRTPLCVTLNDTDAIDPARVLARYSYHHPLYTLAGQKARQRWDEISAVERRTHFCGAYWGNGFHEDGVVSALRVCKAFGATL
ncbi:MAG: NAD(P)/FAD-dependent oxidoreductase [Phycisphaerales bacterium JB054]